MITINEVEELITLINKGFDKELISFQLEIPMEQLEKYEKQLKIRKYAKHSIENGKIESAIKRLEKFIKNSEHNIVEKLMLTKLKAYNSKTNVSAEELNEIEKQRKLIGFSKNIDEILEELDVQIPNIKIIDESKNKLNDKEDNKEKTTFNYEKLIDKYKTEIESNLRNRFNKKKSTSICIF